MVGLFGYFRILLSIFLLPLSSWFLMLFAGAVADDLGINSPSYGTALVMTIGLWLAVAPLSTTPFWAKKRWAKKGGWMRHAGWMTGEPPFGWRHQGDVIDVGEAE
ncbi:MAG: hypothetical protein ACE5E8_06745 [Acidimicrobiia bacterium]